MIHNPTKRSLLDLLTTFKILRDRSMGWLSALNFMMIGYLFFQNMENKKIGIIFLTIGLIIVAIITILDYIFILPKEQEHYLKVNPEWQKKLKELLKNGKD